jgi:cohesin complex subunit SCC1
MVLLFIVSDFLNYDDDGDFDEAAIDDEPNPDEFQSLDALSGWSSRTRYRYT